MKPETNLLQNLDAILDRQTLDLRKKILDDLKSIAHDVNCAIDRVKYRGVVDVSFLDSPALKMLAKNADRRKHVEAMKQIINNAWSEVTQSENTTGAGIERDPLGA
jgi:hypothetical protein